MPAARVLLLLLLLLQLLRLVARVGWQRFRASIDELVCFRGLQHCGGIERHLTHLEALALLVLQATWRCLYCTDELVGERRAARLEVREFGVLGKLKLFALLYLT